MPTLIVRNVEEEVKKRLVQRAAENGHSMEAEVRGILKEAVARKTWIGEWLELAPRFDEDEFTLPQRSAPRELNLFSSEL